MAQAPEEPRTRRNSNASEYSCNSQYSQFSCKSWKHMIQPQPRYCENGLMTYLEDDGETMARFLTTDLNSNDIPSRDQQEAPVRQRGYFSPMPDLTASDSSSLSDSSIASVMYNQMYSLYPDSSGVLYTRIHGGPVVVNTAPLKDGNYHCLFAFSGCSKRCTKQDWVEHVEFHLMGVEPPKSCLCTICGELFDTGTSAITWNRFLSHILNHNYHGRIIPNAEFREFCRENNLISDFTLDRFDPNPKTQRMSQEPHQYRNQTPRRFINETRGSDSSIARVVYPDWEKAVPEQQQPVERGIRISRSHPRDRVVHR